MDYFVRVKNAIIQKVGPGDLPTPPSSSSSSSGIRKRPVDDFVLRFNCICKILDGLAKAESTVDTEKSLHQSKIHEHIKEVLRHLHAEDRMWCDKEIKSNGGTMKPELAEEVTDHPCFDVFIESRYMDEICRRARQDRPRGSLPIVLVMTTTILRNIRFPLLPHETVHKSLRRLICDASSVSSMYNSIVKSKKPVTREFIIYAKKLDSHLVNLIATLWNKIADNPALLDFFVIDESRSNGLRRLDAISCLIPLMGKPQLGIIAKEALLTAINIHDPRIESYILDETNLKFNILAELSKKFQICVSTLSSQFSVEPISTGTSRNALYKEGTNCEKSSTSLESFMKVLRFSAAVVASATNNDNKNTALSLKAEMVSLYSKDLLPFVKSYLLENGEEQVLAAQTTLRKMLSELYEARATGSHFSDINAKSTDDSAWFNTMPNEMNPLCQITMEFLCKDDEVVNAIVRRVGSVSRSVSVSTIQLLSSLLAISHLDLAATLVLSRSAPLQVAEVSKTGRNNHSLSYDSLDSFTSQYLQNCKESELAVNVQYFTGMLLSKAMLGGVAQDICIEGSEFGPVFVVAQNRLRSFLSLKYDEQLAVTGLVNKCILILLACMLKCPSPSLITRAFEMISFLFDDVRNLVEDLKVHKRSVPDAEAKCEIIRQMLATPSSCNLKDKRTIEKESQQAIRVLESCILIEEQLCEMQGAVLAFQGLLGANETENVMLVEEATGVSFLSVDDVITSTMSDDDGDGDVHDELSPSSQLQILSVENFLAECDDMEAKLDEVISSFSS